MECPYCQKTDTHVIDSRSTKQGLAVRRRRRCADCGDRFTTYESTADKSLLVLVKTDAVKGPTMSNLKVVLGSISTALTALTEETEKLMEKVERAEAAEVSKKRSSERKKTSAPSATDQTVRIVKRFKKGIDISTLEERTGFERKKIHGILFNAVKQGRIKRVGKGLYAGK